MVPLFSFTLALYAVACALYLAHSASGSAADGKADPSGRLERYARGTLALAFLLQAAEIGSHCVAGIQPFADAREAMSFLAWLIVGAYLGATLRYRLPLVGALLVPVTMVLLVASRLGPAREAPHAATLLATLHIGLATAGVAVFAVAAVGSLVYLVVEGQLKRRRFGALFKKGPPLEILDRLNRRCIGLGFPLFTIAMITGAIWITRLPADAHRAEGARLLQPQYLLSTVTWVLYAVLVVARAAGGWRGRRAALMTLAGFGAALCVLAIYYVRGPAGV